jgi:hypothetical protein
MIGDREARVHYVARSDGYRVMVMLTGLIPDSASSMRSTVSLLPGQRQIMTFGGAQGCSPALLNIVRDGDVVTIESSSAASEQPIRN